VEAEIAGNFAPISTIIMRKGETKWFCREGRVGERKKTQKEKKKRNLAASMTRF
jgi:hypothetical protein